MKKQRNITLILGAIVLGFGLLAKVIPGTTITEFVWGICIGVSVSLFIAGIGFAFAPVFCKKKNGAETGSDREKSTESKTGGR